MTGIARWWCPPLPLARVAVIRVLVYLFLPVDVLINAPWIADHADVPTRLYVPLLVGRLLPLPLPTPAVVHTVEAALLVTAVVAATGRAPRLLGTAVFALYFEWLVIGFSYGKVDHDRFALLVALAALPTVGRAGWRDSRTSEAAGWALHCVQLGVVATYFLAALAKLRFSGWDWATSAVLVQTVLRRGTALAQPLLHVPQLLVATQWFILAFELFSPALLLRSEAARVAAVGFLLGFHLVTYAMITIIFLPHVVCLAAFLPLERLVEIMLRRVSAPAATPSPP